MQENKKPAVFYAACDQNNFQYAIPFWRSMTKFHSPKDIDMILYTNEKRPEILKRLPEGIKVVDLTPYLKDPAFFYRQKPILAEPLLDEYELAVGFDVDQLVLNDLSYVIERKDYDVATVINYNRVDPQVYGHVDLMRIGIAPIEYFNCGLVALRSKKFAHHWKVLCFSEQFNRVQYREQDILNVLCYYGNYNVVCLDHGDGVNNYNSWHGLIAKGELSRSELRGKDIVIPKGLGDQPFPPEDMTLRVIHLGGGAGAKKDNWGAFFPPEVMEKINELIK
jgi:hypothetical protein